MHGKISKGKLYDILSALMGQFYRRGEEVWGIAHDLELFDATQGPAKVRVKYLLIGERNTDVSV